MKFFDRGWEVVEELLDSPFEARRNVHHQTADAKVRRRQTAARRRFDQIQNFFALAKAVKENRHRAEVERVRSQPHQVRSDALEFAKQDANSLRAFRNFDLKQLLDRHYV